MGREAVNRLSLFRQHLSTCWAGALAWSPAEPSCPLLHSYTSMPDPSYMEGKKHILSRALFLVFSWPKQLRKLTRAQKPSLKTLRYCTTQSVSMARGFSGLNHLSSLSDLFLQITPSCRPLLHMNHVSLTCNCGLPSS